MFPGNRNFYSHSISILGFLFCFVFLNGIFDYLLESSLLIFTSDVVTLNRRLMHNQWLITTYFFFFCFIQVTAMWILYEDALWKRSPIKYKWIECNTNTGYLCYSICMYFLSFYFRYLGLYCLPTKKIWCKVITLKKNLFDNMNG